MEQIAKGIHKIVWGKPEQYTPEYFRAFPVKKEAIKQLPVSKTSGLREEDFKWKKTTRGITVTLPITSEED